MVYSIYDKLDLIVQHAETDKDLYQILSGENQDSSTAYGNQDAAEEITDHLEMRVGRHMSTSMFDVQSRYQGIPYGWREIDIALVDRVVNDQDTLLDSKDDLLYSKGERG